MAMCVSKHFSSAVREAIDTFWLLLQQHGLASSDW